MKRRNFISNIAGSSIAIGLIPGQLMCFNSCGENDTEPFFTRRGFTICIEDLLTWDWVEKAREAGINTIATHYDPDTIVEFIQSEKGKKFMEDCERYGIEVEHSLHAYSSLLPRYLFKTSPELFRMDANGERVGDYNFCVSNKQTLEIIAENAVKYARLLPSTSGRYFYTYDDAKLLCACPECKGLSASEQTLIVENAIIKALRKEVNPNALISHAAYVYTMQAPRKVKPEPGVFLEWAPISRNHNQPLTNRVAFKASLGKEGEHGRLLDHLYENIEIFGNENAQVFEYWFDSYRASGWKTKEENWVEAPWNPDVLWQDLEFYKRIGVSGITSVTCWTNQEYVNKFGEPPIKEYGKILMSF